VRAGLAPSVTAPVPTLSALVPVNVKSPFQLWVLLLERVIDPPLVLSIVPALIVKVPVPTAAALLMFRVPADSVVPLEKVLAPLRVSVPAPALVMLCAPPPMTPPTASTPPLVVMVGLAPSVTAPLPRLRF